MPKFLVNVDLNQNEIQNVSLQKLTIAPSNPTKGQVYYNTVDNRSYYWNGNSWVGMDSIGATMTAENIVTAINGSTFLIDDDNLSENVNSAITNSHTHTNSAVLANTTASFLETQETKLGYISVTQAVDLDSMETDIATNNAKVTNATHTGEVTGSGELTITANAVTNAKLAQMATMTIKGNNTGATSDPLDLTVAQVKTMLALTKTDVNLANVTNDAQVKKSASSTNGYIPTWDGTTGDALGTGYAVETDLTGGTNALPRADAVKAYVDSLLGANDAMVFKGTIGTGGTITTLPETHSAGWTYKVITAGTYAGHICEIGDMLIAVVDRAGTGNLDTDWTVIQTNIDGAVIGAPSSTNGNFPIFSGTTGKLIANSSYSPTSFATAVHSHGTYDRASSVLTGATVFSNIEVTDGIVTNIATRDLTPASIGASPSNHTHTYTSKFSADLGGSTSQLVTHNLNTKDVVITIRDKTTNEQVITDVEFTSVNTLTVKFAVAPSAGQYRITIVG